jgi:hypothetical protein
MSLLEELEDLLNESTPWRENAERKIEGVLEEIVEDKVPYQLFEIAETILLTSSGMSVIVIRLCPPHCVTNTFL